MKRTIETICLLAYRGLRSSTLDKAGKWALVIAVLYFAGHVIVALKRGSL